MAVEFWPAFSQISRDRFTGGTSEGDNALLHPLAEHTNTADLEIHIARLEVAQLASAQAARIEKFEDGDITSKK